MLVKRAQNKWGIILNQLDYYLEKVLGKQLTRDVYNSKGDLLVANNTMITYDHILMLQGNEVKLTQQDIKETDNSFEAQTKMIDQTVQDIKEVFKKVSREKTIPIAEVRKHIVPAIYTASNRTNILQLFIKLQAKDNYTYHHNLAVGAITNVIGKWMGLEEQELLQLTTAALLHDIGKMFVPESILNKRGKLTKEEFHIMQQHTVYGYDILKKTVGITHRQALVALQHHERMDGSGYPMKIKKEEIDWFSRIVAVADTFHAMSSNRVYQTKLPFYKVITEMKRDMFGVLDPEITFLFIKRTMQTLVGHTVLLTNGDKAKVIMVSPSHPTHPLIKVGNEYIDLNKTNQLHIDQVDV